MSLKSSLSEAFVKCFIYCKYPYCVKKHNKDIS
ncbi:hypothetical protein FHS60_001952 [Alloprevotella rava]|uniref:Uncharacterized protein n=1 Tax=Alloprevotella rava TaxID=671218 RepID=A0A7W5UL36_9BACT|nr:hypothetical protein [Alloprevotella rava]